MKNEAAVGELREWLGNQETFLVVGIDGYRVDVVLSNGGRDGYFKNYLEQASRVISEARGRAA